MTYADESNADTRAHTHTHTHTETDRAMAIGEIADFPNNSQEI